MHNISENISISRIFIRQKSKLIYSYRSYFEDEIDTILCFNGDCFTLVLNSIHTYVHCKFTDHPSIYSKF